MVNILQRCHQRRSIPDEISNAAFIIIDEAHHAITEDRMTLFQEGFSTNAIRIALTATPDYSARRRLEHYFPVSISHLTLYEAFQKDLLAPSCSRVRATQKFFRVMTIHHELEARIYIVAPDGQDGSLLAAAWNPNGIPPKIF